MVHCSMRSDYCTMLFNAVNLHVGISLLGLHFTAIAPCTLLGITLGNSMRLALLIHQSRVFGAADTMVVMHCTSERSAPLHTGLLHFCSLFFLSFPLSLHILLITECSFSMWKRPAIGLQNWEAQKCMRRQQMT